MLVRAADWGSITWGRGVSMHDTGERDKRAYSHGGGGGGLEIVGLIVGGRKLVNCRQNGGGLQ